MRLQQLWGWLRTIFHATKQNNIAHASRFRNAELELQQAYHDQYLATQSYYEYLAQNNEHQRRPTRFSSYFVSRILTSNSSVIAFGIFCALPCVANQTHNTILGICHLKGRLGLNKNDIQARKWLQRAANQGHEQAQLTLAQYLA